MALAWVLEKTETEVKYLAIENGCWVWTLDVSKALRVSRREDADVLAEIVEDTDRVAEHEWIDE